MVRNSICRMFMHSYWWINDPDCMLLRNKLHFSEDEIIGIVTVKAFSGGTFIISDDLECVSVDRMKLAMKLLPPTNIAAVPLDLLVREIPEILRLNLKSTFRKENSDKNKNSINYHGRSDVLELLIDFANEIRQREEDLNDEWTMLGICNWDHPNKRPKTHYLHLIDIFEQTHIIQLVKKFQFLQYSYRKKSDLVNKSNSPELFNIFDNISPVYCLLFLYNFWTETYSHQIVSLNSLDGVSEIEFPDVPHHSAHMLKVGLYDEPSIPLYIGSNLHFSCGCELKRMFITETPLESSSSLKLLFSELISNDSLTRLNYNIAPKIRSVCIQFNEGALRDCGWGGFINIFLPTNASNTITTNIQLTDAIDIVGPAWSSNDEYYPKSKLSDKFISILSQVDEPKCSIKGSVIRIPVSCKKIHLSEKTSQSQSLNDFLIISWIYDVISV